MSAAEQAVDDDIEPAGPGSGPVVRMNWSVHLSLELPTVMSIHPSLYDKIDELLHGHGPVFRISPNKVEIVFGMHAGRGPDATESAAPILRELLGVLDPNNETVVTINVSENVTESEYVGVTEVHTIMGVSKQRVYQLAQKPEFPEPAFRLAAGPFWRQADIYKFQRKR